MTYCFVILISNFLLMILESSVFTPEIEILLYLKRIFLPPFNTWENLFYPFYIKRVFGDSFEELIFDIAAPAHNTKKMGKNT